MALSRGSILAILLGFLFLCLYDVLKSKKIISFKKYLGLFLVLGASSLLISQYFTIDRFFDSNTIKLSYSIRLDRLLEDLNVFSSNVTNILIGDSSNLLGADSDFIVMFFSLGLPVMLLLCFTIFKLVYETINLEMITYFIGAAIVAKGFESLFAGSTWGPPNSFYIFLILGYLYSHKKQNNSGLLISPNDLGYQK